MDGLMDITAWISQQDAEAVVIGAGLIAAAITAVIVLFRQPVIARPLCWLGRKLGVVGKVLVGDPLRRVFRQELDAWAHDRIDPRIDGIEATVAEVRDQFRNNGGSTMRDRVDAVAKAVDADDCPHQP